MPGERPRAGRGDGSLYQLADGRWQAAVSYHDPLTGALKRRTRTHATRAVVAAWRRAAVAELADGRAPVAPRQTLAVYLRWWLVHQVRPSKAPATYDRYHRVVERHIIPALGRHALTDLTYQHVQTWVNGLVESGLAPAYVRLVRGVLRTALNRAIAGRLLAHNAARLVELPPEAPYAALFLTADQARDLIVSAGDQRLAGLVTIALALGLRQAEAIGLRWSDIDLEAGTLTLARQTGRVSLPAPHGQPADGPRTRVITGPPKGRKRARTLPLPTPALAALRRQRTRLVDERRLAGHRWVEHGLVFPSSVGTPLEASRLRAWFKRLLPVAGLPDRLRWHDLRHSAAALLLAQGVDLKTIQEWLGHSQLATTADTYGHVAPALARRAADLIGEALSPRSTTATMASSIAAERPDDASA